MSIDGNHVKLTNHRYEYSTVVIQDMRSISPYDMSPFTLDRSGFTVLSDILNASQIESDHAIKTQYFEHIRALLLRTFPHYTDIFYAGHLQRRRHPAFPHALPNSVEGELHYAQPLTVPHLDYTPTSAAQRLAQLCGPGENTAVDKPFDQLNVWRVTQGPNNDWPLALCDFRTVDLARDAVQNRVVGTDDGASENYHLQKHAAHRWYYVSDQTTDEVIVFRNSCSEGRDKPCEYPWDVSITDCSSWFMW